MFNPFTIPQNFTFKATARGKTPVFTLFNTAPMVEENYDCSFNTWDNREYVDGNPVTDHTINQIRANIEGAFDRYHVKIDRELVAAAISEACREHEFDPLVDRLEAAERLWLDSGKPEQVLTMFQEYLGCEDSEFTRKVTEIFIFGLIGRAFNPGMKYDTFIVFSGEQGQGKSTLFRKLGGAFFNDTLDFSMFGTEQALERLYKGIWLAEIQEMRQVSKSDENTLKAFITTQVDDYRPKYARNVESLPRRMVLVGTTNNKGDLFPDKDNRRFVVLECDPAKQTKHSMDMSEETVELILGEMVAMYRAGIDYKTLSDEISSKQREVNSSYVCRDENLSDLETFLRMPRPADWNTKDKATKFIHYNEYLNNNPSDDGPMVECISTNEIWCEMMGRPDHTMDLKTARSIARELQILGYTKKIHITLPGYGRVWAYCLGKGSGTTPPPSVNGPKPPKEDEKKPATSETVRNCPKQSDKEAKTEVNSDDFAANNFVTDLPWEIDDAPDQNNKAEGMPPTLSASATFIEQDPHGELITKPEDTSSDSSYLPKTDITEGGSPNG